LVDGARMMSGLTLTPYQAPSASVAHADNAHILEIGTQSYRLCTGKTTASPKRG
jgi:hypothetical protein